MHGPVYITKIQAEFLSTWSRHTIHRNRGATAITVPYTAHGYFLQRRYIKHPNVSNCISRCISADIPQLLHVDHLQAFSRCSPRPLYLYYCRIYGRINIIPTPPHSTHTNIFLLLKFYRHLRSSQQFYDVRVT